MLTRTDHTTRAGIRVQKTVFVDRDGEKEVHLLLSSAVVAPHASLFPPLVALRAAINEQSAEEHTPVVFCRFFVRDALSQMASSLRAMAQEASYPISIIQQPPTDGSALAAWVYLSDQHSYTQRWATNITAQGADSQAQTEQLFHQYINSLRAQGLSLAAHCQRTWLFVDDIDHRYSGMVRGRNNIFDAEGLTVDTHFITSTGIAGRSSDKGAYVMLDAVAYDLPQEKVRYLYAPDHMNRTTDYGVRFERGTCLTLPHDNTQVFLAGTASIGRHGEIAHEGDVLRQAERMMRNIAALLSEAHCTTADIQQALVYLRHSDEGSTVEEWFRQHYPALPHLVLHAPVCRPQWLIEMECMAMR